MKIKQLSILLALAASPIVAAAQTTTPVFPIDSLTHKVTYTKVVKVDGASRDELYSRARLWAAKTFASTDKAVQLEDANAGRLVARGWSRMNIKSMGNMVPIKLWFMTQIEVKEGRYRVSVTDLEYQGEQGPKQSADEVLTTTGPNAVDKKGQVRPMVANYRSEADRVVTELLASIEAAMRNPAAASKKADW